MTRITQLIHLGDDIAASIAKMPDASHLFPTDPSHVWHGVTSNEAALNVAHDLQHTLTNSHDALQGMLDATPHSVPLRDAQRSVDHVLARVTAVTAADAPEEAMSRAAFDWLPVYDMYGGIDTTLGTDLKQAAMAVKGAAVRDDGGHIDQAALRTTTRTLVGRSDRLPDDERFMLNDARNQLHREGAAQAFPSDLLVGRLPGYVAT